MSDSTRKDGKTFTLRNVNSASTKTCGNLKDLVRQQLVDDIISDDFDIGYMEGNTVVSLRSTLEVWSDIRQGKKVTIWCDGLREDVSGAGQKSSRKRKNKGEDSNEFNVKKSKEEKDKKVDKVISNLKETHDMNFTNMQYRIWAEMITGGIYSSPPTSSMFMRAGGGSTTSAAVNESLSEIAKCITTVSTPFIWY